MRKVRRPTHPDMAWVAMVELLSGNRTERKIAAWYEAQPRRLGVDLAATCALQLAVSADEAAQVIGRWRQASP